MMSIKTTHTIKSEKICLEKVNQVKEKITNYIHLNNQLKGNLIIF
jgi:hypothetical protein